MGAVLVNGWGYQRALFMTRATHAYQMSSVLAAVVVITFISLFIFFTVEVLARLFMPWYYKGKGENHQI